MPQLVLLGPQRRPTLGAVVASLGLPADGPVATVTAGWQEREPDDGELQGLLGGRGVPLALYARWLDVLDRDREYATAETEHRAVLDDLQQLYLVQLDHALRALYAVARGAAELRRRAQTAALEDALEVVQLLDARHLDRVREVHARFGEAWRPQERAAAAEHGARVRELLGGSAALVVAGGHVGVLLRALELFGVASAAPPVVISWSAGAMALTERVVLFHDRAPQGPAHAEVYDDGLGLVRGVVLLPHARRRLRVEDLTRMSGLAARFAPARCAVLDDGVRLDLEPDGSLPAGARVVGGDGRIVALEAADPIGAGT